MEKWPNFFIVGAAKAGTTSLYEYLKDIPGIYMSPVKEPNYFSSATIPQNTFVRTIRDKEKYLALFKKTTNEKIIGEASPSYLADPQAPIQIHNVCPNAFILISLRDPIEAVFSRYLMFKRLGATTRTTFSDQLKLELEKKIDIGVLPLSLRSYKYSEHIKRYLRTFDHNRIKIIIFEEWIKDKNSVQEIVKFLGLNYTIDEVKEEISNPFSASRGGIASFIMRNWRIKEMSRKIVPSKIRLLVRNRLLYKAEPKPKIDDRARSELKNFFQDDVIKLQNLLRQQLPWKNFVE